MDFIGKILCASKLAKNHLGAELLATMMQSFSLYLATGLQISPFKISLFFGWFKERFSILHTVTFAGQIYDLRPEKQTV